MLKFAVGLCLRGSACLALLWGAQPALAAEPALTCRQLVASGNPEYPPYLWRDPHDENRLIGANAELMDMLSKEIGIPIVVKYVGPWGRVQELTRVGNVDLIAGAFLTMPRLEYMDYAYPPIGLTRSVILTLPDSKLNARTWSDLMGRTGLTVVNNSFGEAFDRYAEKHLRIEKTGSLEGAIKMLIAKRTDYLLYEDVPARAIAARLGVTGLKESSVAISNEDLYLTISYRSACNTGELRGRIAQAMYKFAKEKVMQKLIDKAIEDWRAADR